jgi:hypothetical protein
LDRFMSHDGWGASESGNQSTGDDKLGFGRICLPGDGLAKACNNAVHHATAEQRGQPLSIEASCTGSQVELMVEDHQRRLAQISVPAPWFRSLRS